jgi:hypothetical protein
MKMTFRQSKVNYASFTPIRAGFFYFLILLGIVLWVRDIPNQPDAFTTTLPQVTKPSLMGDPTYFAKAALDIAEHGWVTTGTEWTLNLWPPGFILLEAAIIKTMGRDAPVILILQLFAAVLLAVLMILLNRLLQPWSGNAMALLLPLVIILFPMPRVFLLQPTAITLGESYAILFYLIAMVCSIYAVQNKTLRHAACAGFFLALAAYFRSQFELYLLALSAWGIFIIVWLSVRYLRSSDKANKPYTSSHLIKTIALTIVVAHLLTAPWRMYHWIYRDSIKWVETSSLTFRNSVLQDDKLNSLGGGFVVSGGGNLTCRIDPSTCGRTDEAKTLFIRTLLNHPVEWYSLKLKLIAAYWFSSIENFVTVAKLPSLIDIFTNAIYLAALAGVIILLCMSRMRQQRLWPLLLWINLAFFTTTGLVVSLVHFEIRYFYFPKIYGIIMFSFLASLSYRIHKDKNYKMELQ